MDDDFHCAKSRNDFSFLWDDDLDEMKGKMVHFIPKTIYNLIYCLNISFGINSLFLPTLMLG